MNKNNEEKQFLAAAEAPGTLEALVSQALAVVVAEKRDISTSSDHPITVALAHSSLSESPQDRTEFISDLIAAGVTLEDVIQDYAAEAARHLGYLWEKNQISFVDVTIGTARLQETVRKLAGRRPNMTGKSKRPEILLAVPKEENHLFGIMVAATKFESLGCHVRLAVGQTPKEIAQIYQSQSFDMVGISLAHSRHIRIVNTIVTELRKAPKATPIVLGGYLTQASDEDLKAKTGANHVASDAKIALSLCGIQLPSRAMTREATTKTDQ